MALTSMKSLGGSDCCSPCGGGASDDYPYNLRIPITEDQMEAMGMPMPCVGDSLTLTANVIVSECSDSEYRACTVQITDMDFVKAKGGMYPTMPADD